MTLELFNPDEIVSVKFKKEIKSERYYLSEKWSLLDWILGNSMKEVVRCRYSYISIPLENLTSDYIIKGDNIFYKATIEIHFTNGSYKVKYFNSNEDAFEFKKSLPISNFIEL